MGATLRKMPRKAWWCPSCDVVSFEMRPRPREDDHTEGCPGRFQPVTIVRGHDAARVPAST